MQSTEVMKKYIDEVFGAVMEIYKNAAPELIVEAFKMDVKDVSNLSNEEIRKRLNNLHIDYKVVDTKDDVNICYKDLTESKIIEQYMGVSTGQEADELRFHINENKDVLAKTSVEEIKKMRTTSGMSKLVSDINYVSHEMAHAFEHLIITENPSYVDSIIFITKDKQPRIDYDSGEAFAVSMEKVILDELKSENGLEKYGLSQYAMIENIDEVWDKKRVQSYAKKGDVGRTSDGENISYLDLDLGPYRIIKDKGMEEMIKYIKTADFLKVYQSVPNKDDAEACRKFCDLMCTEQYKQNLISDNNVYQQVNSVEDIKAFIKEMTQIESVQNMSSNECFHFTYLNRAFSIKENGLIARNEDNSKVVKDTFAKVSFSDGRYAAAVLMANFYRVYTDIKTGKRDKSITDANLEKRIVESKNFEEFLGEGMYLIFDGTNIENTGGNRGHINPFDAGTKENIESNKLNVCMLRNKQTGELTYSKFDVAQYLMMNLTQDDYSKIPNQLINDIEYYKENHIEEMNRFKNFEYSLEFMTLDDFCQIYKKEIEEDIKKQEIKQNKTIFMKDVVKNAISNGIATEQVEQMDRIEKNLSKDRDERE